ncbi:MAG: hypothetical protein H6711_00705 [Myxococcales bacterium]|nr:hypothetical protein [Myxococcales bacterium]
MPGRLLLAAALLAACAPHHTSDEAWPAPAPTEPRAPATPSVAEAPPPTPASGAIVMLAPGVHHTCALRDQAVFCWGLNRQGILGVGEPDLEDITQPRRVLGLPPIAEIVADYDFTCARSIDGEVLCWGEGDQGQLGSELPRTATPVQIAGLWADSLVAGFGRVCAREEATFRCWGSGEFGDGERRHRVLAPLEVPALAGADALALSDGHACLRRGGALWCWGHNGSGQLGTGAGGCRHEREACAHSRCLPPKECRHQPLPVAARDLPPIVAIAARSTFTYALDREGRVWRMGQHGQSLDWTDDAPKYRPQVMGELPPAVEIDAGSGHACARTAAGELWCWGENAFGELGHPPDVRGGIEGVARVEGLPPVKAIALGFYFSCALAGAGDDAQIWCWGDNSRGQLGDGTSERRHRPTPVRWP